MNEKIEETPYLPIEVLAKLLGLDVFALKELRKKKIVKAPARRSQWPVSVVTEYVEYLRQLAAGDISEDAHAQRTRLLKEQADKLEMENALTRNSVVEAAAIEKVWFQITQMIKARFIELPAHVAPMVVGEIKPSVVKAIIEKEVFNSLNELSAKSATFAANTERDSKKSLKNDGTPAKVDGERVGRPKPEVVAGK